MRKWASNPLLSIRGAKLLQTKLNELEIRPFKEQSKRHSGAFTPVTRRAEKTFISFLLFDGFRFQLDRNKITKMGFGIFSDPQRSFLPIDSVPPFHKKDEL